MAESVTTNCPNCPEDPCKKLLDDIINKTTGRKPPGKTKGLQQRFEEQINGERGPGTIGKYSWQNHENEYRNQQRGALKDIEEYIKKGCGNGEPIPNEAMEWATKPPPKPEEWKQGNSMESAAIDWDKVTTGLKWAGAGLLLGGLIILTPGLPDEFLIGALVIP